MFLSTVPSGGSVSAVWCNPAMVGACVAYQGLGKSGQKYIKKYFGWNTFELWSKWDTYCVIFFQGIINVMYFITSNLFKLQPYCCVCHKDQNQSTGRLALVSMEQYTCLYNNNACVYCNVTIYVSTITMHVPTGTTHVST